MIKIISIVSFLFIVPVVCWCQTDTIYFDHDYHKCVRDSAEYYGIIHLEKENWYKVDRYYIANANIEMTGHYANIDSLTKEGLFVEYYKSGKVASKGIYHNNKEKGAWEYYYDTLETIWCKCNYFDGHKDGELTSFYKNGKLKRKEYHKFNEAALSEKCYDKHNNRIVCSGDIISGGKCYDEQGNEIAFTPFEVVPEAPYNFSKILIKNLRYPDSARENNIQGRAIVRFAIEKDGAITGIHIINAVSPDIDAEAIRVVSMFEPWSPGLRDDKPTKVYFNLPIAFKLQ